MKNDPLLNENECADSTSSDPALAEDSRSAAVNELVLGALIVETIEDDIRSALNEAFARSVGTFLNALTDEHIRLLSSQARATVALYLEKQAQRFTALGSEILPESPTQREAGTESATTDTRARSTEKKEIL